MIVINGTPKSQVRHKYTRKGNFISTYDPSSEDKKIFRDKVLKLTPKTPLRGDISVSLMFYMPRPQSHFKTKDGKLTSKLKDWAAKLKYSDSQKDIDNLAKFVLDSLNEVIWYDDKYIVELQCRKLYTEENELSRTEIEYWLVED